MKASNNSPLPKGDLNNQELKTKGTIWKPLIAVSLLSVFSFTAGQYLPYAIIAVSGSGAIAAVPLAIFAVSAVVALISVTYLIKLAISRDDNKKEAGLNGQESGHTASQEPQKFVCENCINRKSEPTGKGFDKSVKQDSGSRTEVRGSEHVPKLSLQRPLLTLGTATPQNNNTPPSPPLPPPLSSGAPLPPPPPPPGSLKNWNSSKNNTTGEKSSVGTTQKNAPPKDPKQLSANDDTIINAKANLKKPAQPNNSIDGQQGSVKRSDAVESNQGTDKKETPEAYAARIDRDQEERKKAKKLEGECNRSINKSLKKMGFNATINDYNDDQNKQNNNDTNDWDEKQDEQNPAVVPSTGAVLLQAKSQQSNAVGTRNLGHGEIIEMTKIQHTEEELNEFSKRRKAIEYSDSESDSDNELSDEDTHSTPLSPQPDNKKRSKGPDSGHGSDDNVKPKSTPPLHSAPKAGEPPASPKPADLQTKSPATKVTNEAEKPSAPSFKDRCGVFGEMVLNLRGHRY